MSTIVVGLDVGHSAVKLTFGDGARVLRDSFASLACPAIHISNADEARRAKEETVEVDGDAWFVGATARFQGQADLPPGMRDDWIRSPEHKALIAAARDRVLKEMPQEGPRIWVLGLPVRSFDRDSAALHDIARSVLPHEDEIKVLQQPDALYFLHLYTREGVLREQARPLEESWGIVDVGYFTTDCVLYEEGRYIDAAALRYDGVRQAAEMIQRELSERHIDRSIIEVEEAMRRGHLIHQGQRVDLQDLRSRAFARLSHKITEEVARAMGRRIDSLNGILIGGGGAEFVFEHMRSVWPHAMLVCAGSEPGASRFAVSEGYYRYGRGIDVIRQMGGQAS